jgi:hypothetical protein
MRRCRNRRKSEKGSTAGIHNGNHIPRCLAVFLKVNGIFLVGIFPRDYSLFIQNRLWQLDETEVSMMQPHFWQPKHPFHEGYSCFIRGITQW